MATFGSPPDNGSMNWPNFPVNQNSKRNRPDRRDSEGGSKASRLPCDLFIFIDIIAAIAFIIASLCPVTWITYTSGVDSATTNSSASLFYFSRTRTLFTICPNSAQAKVNAMGCTLLDLAPTPVVSALDTQYWNVIAMRRAEIALFIIAVIFAGVAALLHAFCCVPHCRHEVGHGYWKNGLISGILSGVAAACQAIGMIVYQADQVAEALYNGQNCVDCWGMWPLSVSSQTVATFGPAYALGWCAAGLLVYASVAYLAREFCVVRGCRSPRADGFEDEGQFSEVASAVASLAPQGPVKGYARDMQYNQLFGQYGQRPDLRQPPQPINYGTLRGYYS